MKSNKLCLSGLGHSVVKNCEFCILEREKQLFRVDAIIHDGRAVLNWSTIWVKSKTNAELCVIREKSFFIPVNR